MRDVVWGIFYASLSPSSIRGQQHPNRYPLSSEAHLAQDTRRSAPLPSPTLPILYILYPLSL